MNESLRTSIDIEPVDQKLVHKHKLENVLISNMRRPLPQGISIDIVETQIIPECTADQKKIFMKYYEKVEEDDNYCLQTIQKIFPIDVVKLRCSDQKTSKVDIRFILRFYKKNKKKKIYSLENQPDEAQELRLARIMGEKTKLKSEREKSILSNIFDKYDLEIIDNIFYSNMIVDTNHSYFFEHPNEHVPGMMLIEAVRQLLVAITHKYGKVPLSGFNFVLSNMSGEFKSYLELNFPILIKVNLTDLYAYESGIWADSNFETHIFQNENEAAIIRFQENVITNRVFKRLRSSSEMTLKKTWFILKNNVEYDIILRKKNIHKFVARLEYISYEGCMLILDANQEIEDSEDGFDTIECFMHFSKVGFVHGQGKLKIENQVGNFSQALLTFTEMDKLDKNNLHDVIKKYGYALTD